jgi:hypothetical protein
MASWALGAVVVTKFMSDSQTKPVDALIATALLLPGISMAQVLPSQTSAFMGIRYLNYQDSQPNWKRIKVSSPSVQLGLPVGERWRLDADALTDAISGASPRYHASVSGASKVADRRNAESVKLTHFEERQVSSVTVSNSRENDFQSQNVSAMTSWATADQNTSVSLGLGLTQDRITSVENLKLFETRKTNEISVGFTQALSRNDIAQVALQHSSGIGYFSDPYKGPDLRPNYRKTNALVLMWNHHEAALNTTFKTNYRRYVDSFGIKSHTLSVEGAWSPNAGAWTLTPLVRLYSQDAADFYYNPIYSYTGVPYPKDYFVGTPALISADQRLAAFGALTLGLKFQMKIQSDLLLDFKVDRYQQRTAWHLKTPGSNGLPLFNASFYQIGIYKSF